MSTSNRNIAAGLIAVAIMAAMATGCIKNDIPYPRIQPNFTEFVVENESQVATIDSATRKITVFLNEAADIYNVNVINYELSCGHLVDTMQLKQPINLSKPLSIPVELYQEYEWTVSAVQNIERYFSVEGQVGTSAIDVPAHRIVAYVPEHTNVKQLRVLSIKLGGESAVMVPDLNGQVADFTEPVTVTAEEHGRSEEWTIYIGLTESSVTTVRVDAWSCVAWLYGEAQEGKDNGFEYREASSSEWIRVPADWITYDGGNFTARLIHLQPECEYVARAYSDSEYGAELPFTTETIAELPNSSFDHWWLDGKVWNPWTEGGLPFWDTGNKGAATLGQSNSVPTDITVSGTGQAAKLETKFIGIGMLGKLGAGNIFVGSYLRTEGTNGVLSFGREFTVRPTRLRGYMMYHSAPISSTSAGFADLKNRPDTANIYIALIDTDKPLEIRTNPNNRSLFDPNADYVVAYGSLDWGYDVTEYTPFEITLTYRSTSRKPKYVLCVASASKLGDYFTGGNGSVLYVDDFVLEYDY